MSIQLRHSLSQDQDGTESGYDSAGSTSVASLQTIYFTPPHLKYINAQLAELEPEAILQWCLLTLPNLYQTTAFGLSGLVTVDILSRISPSKPIDLIFLDTLYHFQETLELVDRVRKRYANIDVHVFKPKDCETAEDFERLHGERLWETNDNYYDYLAKVEPAERAYRQLEVKAVLTGRRRSQGGKRGDLDIVEVDDAGLIKINPLANWTFKQVKTYIDKREVPYNVLLDRGYKSVGDWHSTQPVKEGEDERAGRWKGQTKTECGIHNKRSKYAEYLRRLDMQQQEQALTEALKQVESEQF